MHSTEEELEELEEEEEVVVVVKKRVYNNDACITYSCTGPRRRTYHLVVGKCVSFECRKVSIRVRRGGTRGHKSC